MAGGRIVLDLIIIFSRFCGGGGEGGTCIGGLFLYWYKSTMQLYMVNTCTLCTICFYF